MKTYIGLFAVAASLVCTAAARPKEYQAADEGQRLASKKTAILPEKFLRGYDPITVYFNRNVSPGRHPADDGPRFLVIEPPWPGAYFWLDRKTLQFRPAESWPALSRFRAKAKGKSQILTTMMSAPSSMSPASGSDNLKPFRTFTLTFPQALALHELRKMINLETCELPGLEGSNRRKLQDWNLARLPRRSHRDVAVYAITLDQEVPEGKQLQVKISLALGDEGKVLWTGRLSVRPPFQLDSISCGGMSLPVRGNMAVPQEMALSCGNYGETPQLAFSAPVSDITLTALKKLIRLEPSVSDLSFQIYGQRVSLKGKFAPEVLYRMALGPAPLRDEDQRELADPGKVELFFYLGRKQPFLRWKQASAILEVNGPRMIPLVGYGEPRADVRIYRIDPLHQGLWPFPNSPITVSEESSPPFPGEEPERSEDDLNYVSTADLLKHLRLLGSPLVSRVVDLPLARRGSTTHFGLDIGRILDQAVGLRRPGHYLVGLRSLTGPPQRSYVRVQVTDLSLTTVEERDRVVFHVRTIGSAEPVSGSKIVIQAVEEPPKPRLGEEKKPQRMVSETLITDERGRAAIEQHRSWIRLHRIQVQKGEDLLILDPRDPPPRFTNNHWSPWGQWLHWITEEQIPEPANDRLIGFVFTERPIYRPGEKIYIKGYVRNRIGGEFKDPGPEDNFTLKIEGPGGKEWSRPVSFTPLRGFSTEFEEKDIPTGQYSVLLFQKKPHQEVARRSFQVEAYRVPTFEVQLLAPDKVPNDGPFKVKAVARYYAGGSVSRQPIKWRVSRQPYHYLPKGREGYLFASSTQFSREGSVRPPESTHQEGELDESGAHELVINPALDMDGSARVYQIEATVTGVDNQQVSALHQTKALPPFVLGIKLRRYFEKPITLTPGIIASGVDEKLVVGQKVTVRLYRRSWHSHLRETDFATGKSSYVTEQQDNKILEKTISTGKTSVEPKLPITASGVYVVELLARDKLGRLQTLSVDLYIGGKEPIAWKKPSQGVFELSTDLKKYQPGQTAQLIIKSPFQKGRALVILEEPGGNACFFKDILGGKAVHPIPIKPQYIPNLPVHVLLMRGRLGEGTEGDQRYRPQTLASSLDIEVEPTENEVFLDISHPETVRPGSTVNLTITLKDDRKQPLPGEVTLWLVDEAVLSLAEEAPLDPLKTFLLRNRRGTSICDTRNMVIGRIQEEEEPAGDGEEEDQEGKLPGKRTVRKTFMTVPYYQATLSVGASGKITLPVKISDDLSNFMVRAVAASRLSRFGFKETRLRVRLPVLVQPQLPRFVRQGDSFYAGGVGRLVEGAEGPGVVAVRVSGLLQEKSWKKPIELARNRAESHLFRASAHSQDPTQLSEVTVRMDIVRTKDQVGDAFEVRIPLLPDRTLEHFAYFERFKSGRVRLRDLPEEPREGKATQEIVVSAVPGVLELLASLDYLEAYPHGCLEQKLSRLMPQLAVGKLLQELGLNEHYALQVGQHAKRLLDELDVFQDEEGFYTFWPGSSGSVQLTAQATLFMHLCRQAGVEVPQRPWSRAIGALKSALRSDYRGLQPQFQYNQQSTAIRALTVVGELDEHYLIGLFHHRKDMDLTSLADLSVAMSLHPSLFSTNLSTLKKDLWESVIFKLYRGKPVYQDIRWRRSDWYSDYLGSRTSTLASVFESLCYLDPTNERLSLLRDALLSHASADSGFGSTHNSQRAIAALVVYLARARHEVVNAQVTLSEWGTLNLTNQVKVAKATIRSTKRMDAVVSGADEVGAQVRYTYLPKAPGDQVDSLNQGLAVSRSATIVHPNGPVDTHFDDEKGKLVRLKVGDLLEIHARLLSQKDLYHVALVVPFAAGLEPLNPELKTSGSEAKPSQGDSIAATYTQRLDHEVRFYFIHLPRGTHALHFRLRATCEGSFVHPAPYAEQMYHQEVRGRGVGMRILVVGEYEKP